MTDKTEIIVITKDDLGEILRQEFKAAVFNLREQLESKPTPEIMSKTECAEYLRCDAQKINRYMKKGLPFERFGSQPLFRKSNIDAWLQSS